MDQQAIYSSSATITRPANTTAYTALDVVSTEAGAVLEFTNMGQPNGVVYITAASLRVDVAAVPSGMGVFRLHLYKTAPTAIADNAAFDLPSGDRAKYCGYLDIGTPIDLGATLWAQNDETRKQVDLSGTSIYGILQTVAGFTPTSAAVKTITLRATEK
jgi:hypothetical protein